MFETKYSKVLTILLIVIIVAIIILGGYLGYNYYKDYKTGDDSSKFVSTFAEEVGNTTDKGNTDATGTISDNIAASDTTSNGGKKTQTYKGYNVIGTIEIPKTNIKYPILEGPPTIKKLDTSVAALYPQNAELNTEGNVVISGHNYRNDLFFSNNKKLSNGDKIYITDLNGTKLSYTIYNIFQTEENDTSFYNRDTDGAKEITLSTCTDDTSARLIVEAKAE